LLINIGGNQASMGSCIHSASIPIGLNTRVKSCSDPGRGIISRISEKEIPVIHLLNIKNILLENTLHNSKENNVSAQVLSIIFVLIIIALIFNYHRHRKRNS